MMLRRIISVALTCIVLFNLMPQAFSTNDAADSVEHGEDELTEETETMPASEDEEEASSAASEVENPADWDAMFADMTWTGDWRKDLVAAAATQVGYKESSTNYIMVPDSYGYRYTRCGYSRYGHWYDMSDEEYMYRPWCAMFISFCMYYAGIPSEKLPYDCDCVSWRDALIAIGCYEGEEDKYVAQSGDLIFFNWELGIRGTHELPEHVGIVESVDDMVYTIEGNADASSSVVRRSYAKDDLFIVGYCNMSRAMELAGWQSST